MGRTKPKSMQKAGLANSPAPHVNLVTPNKSSKSTSPKKKFQKQDHPINIDAGSANTSKSKSTSKRLEEAKVVERPLVMPKKSMPAYFLFSISQMKAGFRSELKVTERTKLIAEEWKVMTDQAKQKYVKMSEVDKERFEREMEQQKTLGYFINQEGIKSTQTKIAIRKLPMDTVKPKKPTNSLFLYMKATTEAFKAKNPGLKLTDMTKKMSELFNNLATKEKSKYTKLGDEDKARYHNECEQLQTLGYFVNSEGIKSTQLEKVYTKSERKQIREEQEQKKAKDQKEKEKQKVNEASQKSTQSQYDEQEKETIGWEFFYTVKYAEKMKKATGKTDKLKKKNVDELLQKEWLDLKDPTKIKYIRLGLKKKEEESEYKGTPKKAQKRGKQAEPVEEAQVTQKKTTKRQRVQ